MQQSGQDRISRHHDGQEGLYQHQGQNNKEAYNQGAQNERPGDVHIELIVDRHGRYHHPVILAYQHPVVVYGLLEALRSMPFLEPARESGEPVASLFKYIISPTYDHWDQGGETFRNRIREP